MIENDLLLFLIDIIKETAFIYSKGAISERVVDNWAFLYTNVCYIVTKLSASPTKR